METGNVLRTWRQSEDREGPQRRNNRRKTLDFSRFAEEGNHFINEVAGRLGANRNTAARITRAVLHAVRDRLPPNDAIEFAQGLPMALKAVYIEQYDISATPVLLRRPHDFLDYIFYKNEVTAHFDFPYADSVEEALHVVFRVLEKHMEHGQISQIKRLMGRSIADMIDGREIYYMSRSPLKIQS